MPDDVGISLDYNRARERLRAAISLAGSDAQLPQEWEKRATIIGVVSARTYTPFLGTALLARATDDRIDALAIKKGSGPRGYSARTLCHNVLVPASKLRRFDIRTTGREPLNNQPFFRYDRVDLVERVKNEDLHLYLVPFLREINELSSEEALTSLAAFLRVCFQRTQSAADVSLQSIALGLRASIEAARTLSVEDVEGGRRAQALTAAAFDLIYSPSRVRSLLVNDPSRHFPGDVQAFDASENPLVAAEVRAKPVPEAEIEQFARDLAEAAIPRGVLIILAADQPKLPYFEIAERIGSEIGVLMTIIDSVDDLLLTAFAWSTKSLPDVLSEFPERVMDRLRRIDASQASIRRWVELVSMDRPTNSP